VRIISAAALCFLYTILLGKIPFVALTFLFIFGFIVFFEFERKTPVKMQIKMFLAAVAVAVCSSAAIYSLFRYLFFVRLP
jgi:hypothetical protein